MMLLVVITALALISMMFFLMSGERPSGAARGFFGVLNTGLFFPSAPSTPSRRFPPG